MKHMLSLVIELINQTRQSDSKEPLQTPKFIFFILILCMWKNKFHMAEFCKDLQKLQHQGVWNFLGLVSSLP